MWGGEPDRVGEPGARARGNPRRRPARPAWGGPNRRPTPTPSPSRPRPSPPAHARAHGPGPPVRRYNLGLSRRSEAETRRPDLLGATRVPRSRSPLPSAPSRPSLSFPHQPSARRRRRSEESAPSLGRRTRPGGGRSDTFLRESGPHTSSPSSSTVSAGAAAASTTTNTGNLSLFVGGRTPQPSEAAPPGHAHSPSGPRDGPRRAAPSRVLAGGCTSPEPAGSSAKRPRATVTAGVGRKVGAGAAASPGSHFGPPFTSQKWP